MRKKLFHSLKTRLIKMNCATINFNFLLLGERREKYCDDKWKRSKKLEQSFSSGFVVSSEASDLFAEFINFVSASGGKSYN